MLMSLFVGLAAGFVLAIPPGPVGVTAMRLSLDKGEKHGFLAALGTSLMDFIFVFIAVFATSAVISLVDKFSTEYPVAVLIIQLGVIAAILAYGFLTFRNRETDDIENEKPGKSLSFVEYLKNRGPFLLGFAVALANIANPSFLGSISYVSMLMQKWAFIDASIAGRTLYALGFGIGTFLWLYILVKIIIFYKPRMSEDTIIKIKKFAGITLIGFGTILGYRVLEITKWPEIIRLIIAL